MNKLSDLTVANIEDVQEQVYDYVQAHTLLAPYRQIGDLLVACKMGLKISDKDMHTLVAAIEHGKVAAWSPKSQQLLKAARRMNQDWIPVHLGNRALRTLLY